MSGSKNPDIPWSKYFVNEIEFGKPYSIWEKIAEQTSGVYADMNR
jgi:hypothetical protein